MFMLEFVSTYGTPLFLNPQTVWCVERGSMVEGDPWPANLHHIHYKILTKEEQAAFDADPESFQWKPFPGSTRMHGPNSYVEVVGSPQNIMNNIQQVMQSVMNQQRLAQAPLLQGLGKTKR